MARALALFSSVAAVVLATASGASGAVAITTVAGTGGNGFSGDGGPATAAQIYNPAGVIPYGGGFLFADRVNERVRWVDANGNIHTVAGNGSNGFAGDGGPATAASLSSPTDVSAVPDSTMGGGFLIADTGNKRIRWVTASGTISTVAGCTSQCSGGDGDPATQNFLNNPAGVDATPDGGFLITDTAANRIRKAVIGGSMTTVYGTAAGGSGPNELRGPADVTSTGSGFLIADTLNNRVVRSDGVVIAGTGTQGFSGDGGPATQATLYQPDSVEQLADGSILIADKYNNRVRLVRGGTIQTVAGGGSNKDENGIPPTSAEICAPDAVGVPDPSGTSFWVSSACNRVRLVAAASTPADTTPPVITLSGKKKQKLGRSVSVTVGSNEACTAVGTGTLSVPNAARVYKLKKASNTVSAGGKATLALKIPKKARRAAARALKAGKRVAAKLKVTGTDAAGNAATKKRTVRLKR